MEAIEQRVAMATRRGILLDPDSDAPILELAREGADPQTLFIVGNLMFGRSPELALSLHRRAYEARPSDETRLELAIDLHRRGECREAIAVYREVSESVAATEIASALMAHCLIAVGELEESVAAFRQSGHARNHTRIESLFDSIYRPFDATRLRERLAREARAGNPERWVELVMNDLAFYLDSQNEVRHDAALAVDLPAARAALASHAELRDALEFVVRASAGTDETRLATEVAERFPARLPGPVALATRLIRLRLEAPNADAAAIAQAYEADLRARYEAGDSVGSRIYPVVLFNLNRGAEVAPIDRALCERGSVRSCASALVDVEDTTERRAAADRLMRQFPNDPRIPNVVLRADLAGGNRPRRQDLVAYLRTRPYSMPSSYGWKFAFLALDADLRGIPVSPEALEMTLAMLEQDGEGSQIPCDPWSYPEALASTICRH